MSKLTKKDKMRGFLILIWNNPVISYILISFLTIVGAVVSFSSESLLLLLLPYIVFLGFFLFTGIFGLIKIFKEYKSQKSLIEKEPDWVSWFYYIFITIWILNFIMSLFRFFSYGIIEDTIYFYIIWLTPILIWCGHYSIELAKKYKGHIRVALIFGIYGFLTLLLYYVWVKFVDIEDKNSVSKDKRKIREDY